MAEFQKPYGVRPYDSLVTGNPEPTGRFSYRIASGGETGTPTTDIAVGDLVILGTGTSRAGNGASRLEPAPNIDIANYANLADGSVIGIFQQVNHVLMERSDSINSSTAPRWKAGTVIPVGGVEALVVPIVSQQFQMQCTAAAAASKIGRWFPFETTYVVTSDHADSGVRVNIGGAGVAAATAAAPIQFVGYVSGNDDTSPFPDIVVRLRADSLAS